MAGFISDFKEETIENQKYPKLKVVLAFKNNKEMKFADIRRISRPGRRVYVKADKIYLHARGKSALIVSTSSGIMSGSEARKKGLGGELIGEVV
jgi:small subunit ribosomal protein S8